MQTEYSLVSKTLPALKGLAILWVVMYHLWGYSKGWLTWGQILTEAKDSGGKGIVEGFLNTLCLMGENGVHIFLIASGFGLAASWYHRTQKENSSGSFQLLPFWRRRVLRLLPLYWLAHAIALFIFWVQPVWVPFGQDILAQGFWGTLPAILASLTTLRNLIFPYYFFLNNAWWYVGLSLQLYLIFPLLIKIGKRWGWGLLLGSSLAIALTWRSLIVALPWDDMTTDILLRGALFPSRLFGFVFGMVLAINLLSGRSQPGAISNLPFTWLQQNIAFSGLLWILGLACDWASSDGVMVWRIPADVLIGVGEFSVLYQCLRNFPRFTGLQPFGNYSYGIYLTHSNIFVGLWQLFVEMLPSYWLRFSIVTMLTCLIGGCFEWVYNRIGKRKIGR